MKKILGCILDQNLPSFIFHFVLLSIIFHLFSTIHLYYNGTIIIPIYIDFKKEGIIL